MLQFYLLFHPGEIQDIINYGQESFASFPYAFDELLLLDGQGFIQEEAGEANYCVHRRPELMGHVGEERRLGHGRRLCSLFGQHQLCVPLNDLFFHMLALGDIDNRHPEAMVNSILDRPGLNQHPEVSFSFPLPAIQREHCRLLFI